MTICLQNKPLFWAKIKPNYLKQSLAVIIQLKKIVNHKLYSEILHLATAVFFALFIAFIPISKALASIAEVCALVFFVAFCFNRPNRARALQHYKHNKVWPYALLIWLLYFVSFAVSHNKAEAFKPLNTLHYLLLLPILTVGRGFCQRERNFTYTLFLITNMLVAVLVLLISFFNFNLLHGTPINPSPFIQHPRASLCLAVAIVLILNFMHNTGYRLVVHWLLLMVLAAGLFFLKARIGLVVLVLAVPVFYAYKRVGKPTFISLKTLIASVVVVLLAATVLYRSNVFVPRITAEIAQIQSNYSSADVNNSSLGLRVIYYQCYFAMFEQYPLLGVGTGDMLDQADVFFKKHDLAVAVNKPHNQYLQIAVEMGAIGLFLMFFLWANVLSRANTTDRAVQAAFITIMLLSMLSDSTLGTQPGAMLVIAFSLLFSSNGQQMLFEKIKVPARFKWLLPV